MLAIVDEWIREHERPDQKLSRAAAIRRMLAIHYA
jgi:hypothetical protein